jgi:hypothetical protein
METLFFGKTYDEIFEKEFKKFTRGMEDHSFNHYNNSLGMQIYSKEHLKYEMKKRRMLPFEVCEGLAEQWESKKEDKLNRDFDHISDNSLDIIRSLKMSADRHGNIKLGDRAINELIKLGAIQRRPEFHGTTGGFSN